MMAAVESQAPKLKRREGIPTCRHYNHRWQFLPDMTCTRGSPAQNFLWMMSDL